MKIVAQVIAALAFLACAQQANAQETYYFEEAPTVKDYKALLFGAPDQIKLQTRGLKMKSEPAIVATATVAAARPAKVKAPASESAKAAVPLLFDFNSDAITTQARPYLDNLVVAMKSSQAEGYRLMITGHTDVIGTPDYNAGLSSRRAMAVRTYLVARGIEPKMLVTAGVGDREPLPGLPGDDGRNRRVEFQGKK